MSNWRKKSYVYGRLADILIYRVVIPVDLMYVDDLKLMLAHHSIKIRRNGLSLEGFPL